MRQPVMAEPESSPINSRIFELLMGAMLVAVTLFTHVWTRGDVELGLFGGKYCNGVRCETWSWTYMQVADRMTLISYLLMIFGLVTIGCAIAAALMTFRGATVHSRGPRFFAAITAILACIFVLRFRSAFNHAPAFGFGVPLIAAGLVLIWIGVRSVDAEPLPSARILDTHSR